MDGKGDYDTLTRRIAALDRDVGLELDGERRVILEERRADLAQRRDAIGAELQIEQDAPEMMDARILMTENTLRGLDAKMDKLIDQIHDMDTRHRLLEQQVNGMKLQMDDMKVQVEDVRHRLSVATAWNDPVLSREWIILGALAIVVVLALLVLISWRVL